MEFGKKHLNLWALLGDLPEDAPQSMGKNLGMLVVTAAQSYKEGVYTYAFPMRDGFYRMVMHGLLCAVDPGKWGRFDAKRLQNFGNCYCDGIKDPCEWPFVHAAEIADNIAWLGLFGIHATGSTGMQIYTDIARELIEVFKKELNITDLEEFVAPVQEPQPSPDLNLGLTWEGVVQDGQKKSWEPPSGDCIRAFRVMQDFNNSSWILLLTDHGLLCRLDLDGTCCELKRITPVPANSQVHLSADGKFVVYVQIQPSHYHNLVTTAELIVWDVGEDKEFARIPNFKLHTPEAHMSMQVGHVECGMAGDAFRLSAACRLPLSLQLRHTWPLDIGPLYTWVFDPQNPGSLQIDTRQEVPDEVVLGPALQRGPMSIMPVRCPKTGEVSLVTVNNGVLIRLPLKGHWNAEVFDYSSRGFLVCSRNMARHETYVSVSGGRDNSWYTSYCSPSSFGARIVAGALHPSKDLAIVVSDGRTLYLVGPQGPRLFLMRDQRAWSLLSPGPSLQVLYVGFTVDGDHVKAVIQWGRNIEVLTIPID